ncbi:MAG: hypothetical protein WAX38_02730 [Minisyncoccia bacterium]
MYKNIKIDASLIVNIASGIILAAVVGHVLMWVVFALGFGNHKNGGYMRRDGGKMMHNKGVSEEIINTVSPETTN